MIVQTTMPIKTMRDAFIEGIYERMAQNDKIFFLSADFGAPALDKLRADFPDRFVNVGIAEQNLINIAAGLALEGFTVYAYAIAPFLSMRAFEQIRINLAMLGQTRPMRVNLIGVGAGLSYDVAGPTHHCIEDINALHSLPNLEIINPSDWESAASYLDDSMNRDGIRYFRFDGKPLPALKRTPLNPEVGFSFLQEGAPKGTALITTGFMTQKLAGILDRLNIRSIALIDIQALSKLNHPSFLTALSFYSNMITLEENYLGCGGLDSVMGHFILSHKLPITLESYGLKKSYVFEAGGREAMHRDNGMDEMALEALLMRLKDNLQ